MHCLPTLVSLRIIWTTPYDLSISVDSEKYVLFERGSRTRSTSQRIQNFNVINRFLFRFVHWERRSRNWRATLRSPTRNVITSSLTWKPKNNSPISSKRNSKKFNRNMSSIRRSRRSMLNKFSNVTVLLKVGGITCFEYTIFFVKNHDLKKFW